MSFRSSIASSSSPPEEQPQQHQQLEIQWKTCLAQLDALAEKRVNKANSEAAHWKQVAANQRQKILALDSDLLSYERRVSDLDAQIQNLSVDNANLVHSRQLVVDRYTELKRTALELEMFRQSIVKMVKDPSSNPGGLVSSVLDDKSFDLNNANHLIMSPGKAATSPQSRNLHTQHYQQQPQLQQQLQQQQHQNHLQSINNPSFHHHRTSEGFSMYLDDDDDKSMMLKSIDLSVNDFSHHQDAAQGLLYTSPDRLNSQPSQSSPSSIVINSNSNNNTAANGNSSSTNSGKSFSASPTSHIVTRSSIPKSIGSPLSPVRQSFTAANGIGIAQDLISHQRTESTVTATPTPRSPDVQQSSKKPSSQQQQHNHKQQHFLHHSLDLETVSEEVHHHPPPPPVDAALLYREIRDSLTPLEFDKFADSVAAFNAGRASAEDSIYAISLIIKDSYLFSQMKRLISDAILEDQKRQVVESTNSGSLSLPTAPHPTAAAEAKEF